jgi:hypothetical protein
VKWSGAIRLEIESMVVEGQRQISNMRNQVDEFHKEKENK